MKNKKAAYKETVKQQEIQKEKVKVVIAKDEVEKARIDLNRAKQDLLNLKATPLEQIQSSYLMSLREKLHAKKIELHEIGVALYEMELKAAQLKEEMISSNEKDVLKTELEKIQIEFEDKKRLCQQKVWEVRKDTRFEENMQQQIGRDLTRLEMLNLEMAAYKEAIKQQEASDSAAANDKIKVKAIPFEQTQSSYLMSLKERISAKEIELQEIEAALDELEIKAAQLEEEMISSDEKDILKAKLDKIQIEFEVKKRLGQLKVWEVRRDIQFKDNVEKRQHQIGRELTSLERLNLEIAELRLRIKSLTSSLEKFKKQKLNPDEDSKSIDDEIKNIEAALAIAKDLKDNKANELIKAVSESRKMPPVLNDPQKLLYITRPDQ